MVGEDYTSAEQEYHTAIRLDPQDAVASPHGDPAGPQDAMAHNSLGNLLGGVEEG